MYNFNFEGVGGRGLFFGLGLSEPLASAAALALGLSPLICWSRLWAVALRLSVLWPLERLCGDLKILALGSEDLALEGLGRFFGLSDFGLGGNRVKPRSQSTLGI